MAMEDDEVENGANPGTLAFLGVFFLPAGVTALIFYLLLRKGRLRLSSLFQLFLVFETLMVLLWVSLNVTDKFLAAVSNPTKLGENWQALLLPVMLFYFALGGFAGLFIVWWEIKQMKANPHRLALEGNWQYKFEFRRGITQVLKRRKNISGLKLGHFVEEDKAPLGLNEEEEDRVVSRYYAEASTHTLVSGASGSGKSITLQSLIRADLINHIPTIVIDFKRSPEFASKVASWAKESGCEFYHFVNGDLADYDIKDSEGPVRYDPIGSGSSATAKADMVLGMREYDTASAVYKANMQQLLQVLFSMLHYADRSKAPSIKWSSGGIYQLASAVAGDNFTELTIACEGTPIETEAQEVAAQLKGKTGLRHALEELQGQVRTIISSEYGPWMKTAEADRGVDIFDLTSKPGTVIMFSLNSDSEPEFAKYVGSMILSDITNTSARRRNQQLKNQVNIYVDEFQAVNPTAVTGLLEKSRESKMAVTLAQQSFEQVVSSAPANGEAYLLSILDTCSNFIIHNGMTEDSAERLSKILGKHWVTQYRASNQNQSFFLSFNWRNKRDSVITTAKEEDWVFPPRKFMTLMSPVQANDFKSTAVVINKSCSDPAYAGREGAVARRLWMIPSDEVLDTYYDPAYRLAAEDSTISIVHDDGTDVELMKQMDLDFPGTRLAQSGWEAIAPQEHDYLASKRAQAEDPEDEGDFDFEYIGEEAEEENDLASYKADLADRPDPETSLPETRPASELTLPSIKDDPLAQWGSSAVSPPPRRVRAIKEPEVEDAPLPPLPSPHKGGLPIPPPRPNTSSNSVAKPSERKTQDGGAAEELTLPNL